MKRPNIFLNLILGFLVKIFAIIKGQRIIKKCKIKGPSIILSNHTSFYDFIYTSAAMYPKRISYLAAKKMFYETSTKYFLRIARAIPKSLMQADPLATLHAFRILKKKGIISIFPEGQISPSGRLLIPAFSIAKFLKKANASVYIVKHMGAGLSNPPWSKKTFKGRVDTIKELIISQQELTQMSHQDIYQIVCDKLYYSQTEYNQIKKYQYKLNDISNLENVIYQCPSCKHEGLISKKHQLICTSCNNTLTYDTYGLINGKGLDELYLNQAEQVKKEIDQDPNYQIEGDAKLMSFRNQKLVEVGSGVISIKRFEYTYKGTIDGEYKELKFNVSSTPTLPSDIGRNIQIYEGDYIYQFELDIKWLPIKMVHVGEYLYQLNQK
ncbi:MAG: 1-acyl-sn-glycerol-3-phosphate acyltransferase [Tenericutes bacterium]|nr:1-acyl-sn-glycerol-3-phosphate acyltransferase [Mycoplasmatota bacterium]